MEIRMLKLTDEKRGENLLSSSDILNIHLDYFKENGKVTYSTDSPIASEPDYMILTLSNVDDVCYLCHVEKCDFKGKSIRFYPDNEDFIKNSPDKYKHDKKVTWLLFDSMEKIQVDFLEGILSNKDITNFIKDRANNKYLK